ncbi:hypothetical protein Moror_5591 [Moniliophthora roreri MCA 2997]|uniref:Uncharacterized protein n=2 Tax=Moniliophthora roreri TaxID=221103 RepID=V2X5S5_MONRO|nr:hypothetical protein Moror_5591 [Moniliophthora roreri MCA 2997]KAI3603737.1 hypothetical protein WG66_006732 [Moniliophthora roreri]
MFNNCSGFDISGGVFNNVQGDQHNVTHHKTIRVRGAYNTYKTVNKGSYNVTNNGVSSGRGYQDLGYQQGLSPFHDRASSFYGPGHHNREYEDIQQPQPRPGIPHYSTESVASDDDDDDDLYEPHQQLEHPPTPPASAPPMMTGNFDDVHYDQSRAGESRAAPMLVQNETSQSLSAQQPQLQTQVRRSPSQSSSERIRAFPVPGESRGAPRAQVIHPSSHSAPAHTEMQDQDVNMVEEDGGADTPTSGQ